MNLKLLKTWKMCQFLMNLIRSIKFIRLNHLKEINNYLNLLKI